MRVGDPLDGAGGAIAVAGAANGSAFIGCGTRLDAEIVIGRVEGVVQVTCRGEPNERDRQQLRQVLADLVDGQGNLAVAVAFPDIDVADLALVAIIVEAAERSLARGGNLSARTKNARWTSGSTQRRGPAPA